jgi:DMSO reductase anchor subunit
MDVPWLDARVVLAIWEQHEHAPLPIGIGIAIDADMEPGIDCRHWASVMVRRPHCISTFAVAILCVVNSTITNMLPNRQILFRNAFVSITTMIIWRIVFYGNPQLDGF